MSPPLSQKRAVKSDVSTFVLTLPISGWCQHVLNVCTSAVNSGITYFMVKRVGYDRERDSGLFYGNANSEEAWDIERNLCQLYKFSVHSCVVDFLLLWEPALFIHRSNLYLSPKICSGNTGYQVTLESDEAYLIETGNRNGLNRNSRLIICLTIRLHEKPVL